MLDELEMEKQKFAEMQGVPVDEVSVPVELQLDILAQEVGVMKGKSIRGLGYGPQKESVHDMGNPSSDHHTRQELLSLLEQQDLKIMAQNQQLSEQNEKIVELQANFNAFLTKNGFHTAQASFGDDNGENDDAMYGADEQDHGFMQ